jgi:S-formylglutathione hydrolase FrmB
MPTRRAVLVASAGLTGAALTAAVGWRAGSSLVTNPEPWVPDDPEGVVRLERIRSIAMGGDVDLFTAVPHGFGDGNGLPVVVVLHGASASARELREFGLGRFVTAAVRAGTPPFVLAGTDDGPVGWTPAGGVDPSAMLRDELPGWLEQRGFAARRRALWGWSRGGYGALAFAAENPRWAGSLALFSPALGEDDALLARLGSLDRLPVGLWCGEDDSFVAGTRAVADALPTRPEVEVFEPGGHTRVFWNDHTLAAFDWLASHL